MTIDEINIIVFMGLIEGPDYYTKRFIEYLNRHSISYYVAYAKKPETYLCKEFHEFASRSNTAMFTFNNVGLMLTDNNEENYWKLKGIPVFDHILDHPRNYDDSMLDPKCDLHVFALDRDHVEFINRFYPKVRSVVFAPNGGAETNDQTEYFGRDIDVIYMGNCNTARVLRDANEFEDGGRDFNNSSVQYLINNPSATTEEAIEKYFIGNNIEISEDELLEFNIKYAGCIESLTRRFFKLEGIKALDEAGVHVEIYGDGWNDKDYIFSDNISIHKRIKVDELMKLIGRAKISLCFIPWFKNGCSEKNFDSMLNGALCVTDRSGYLEENYRDGYNIIYFDLNNPKQMAADVKWLLDNQNEAEVIARRGYYTARKFDTWDNRFDNVIKRICEVLDADRCADSNGQ